MTEIAKITELTKEPERLRPAVERFVLKWGDMGGEWGVNRSVAQIHALLYLSEFPMTAEDIADQLGIARSNVSNSLKELTVWGLVKRVPVRGDRRDHFEAEGDIWDIVTRIAEGRKAREIDPVAVMLKACIEEANRDDEVPVITKRRIREMYDFTLATDRWFGQILNLPRGQLKALLKLGAKVAALLPAGKS